MPPKWVDVEKPSATLVRRLLRSLSDPPAVAANPLVAPLFEQGDGDAHVDRVRAVVLEAVEALKPPSADPSAVHRMRQYEILMRYDVQLQPLDQVLAALWIEKSQFYRERQIALEAVHHTIRTCVETSVAAHSREEYRIATTLQRSGNAALALSIYERLACASGGAERARYLLRIAELHVDAADMEAASEAVAAALSPIDGDCDADDALACDAAIVRAQMAWSTGNSARARELIDKAAFTARALAGSGRDGCALLGKALALQATIAFHVSTLDECARIVADGLRLMRDVPDDRAVDALGELLTIDTSIHTAKPGALSDARASDDALMALARDRRLVRKLAVGVKDLAVINHYGGNKAEAQLYADQALALSAAVCNTKERAVATFEWAHIRIECGDAAAMPQVRRAIEDAGNGLPAGGFWWAYAYAMKSFALLAERRWSAALDDASVALSAFQTIASDRGVGIARALQSRALARLGEPRESRLRAEQAIQHLTRAPQAIWLPYAGELLAPAS